MRHFIRRRWLLFSLLACALLAAGAYWFTRPRLSLTKETCAKIRLGMTRAEVEALIGEQEGLDTHECVSEDGWREVFWELPEHAWSVVDQGMIDVVFGPEGRLRYVRFVPTVQSVLPVTVVPLWLRTEPPSYMRVRYRETGKTDYVELGDDGHLAGFGDPFQDASEDPQPYFITPDTFNDDWVLVEATDDQRRRLRHAGFRID